MIPAELASTMVIAWRADGQPSILAGPWSERTLLPVHVITAANPDGRTLSARANAERHRLLVEQLQHEGCSWIPAVAASLDGTHHELSVAVSRLGRSTAVGLGRRFGQRAVLEIGGAGTRVVPCDGGPVVEGEVASLGEPLGIDHDRLIEWRAEHEALTGVHLGRVRCPDCDAADPAQMMWGMPMGMPPDWFGLGGCCISMEDPEHECRRCGRRW